MRLEIKPDVQLGPVNTSNDIVKIVWQGERIAKLIFASGKIIDFTASVEVKQAQ